MLPVNLEERSNLPQKAGQAQLVWGKTTDVPFRENEKIYLPYNTKDVHFIRQIHFIPLLGGDQFVFRFPHSEGPRVFFGGTDEQPFLVELHDSVLKPFIPQPSLPTFKEKTVEIQEEKFFDMLKPSEAKQLEKRYQTQAVRQGDWFATPLPLSWDEAEACLLLSSAAINSNGGVKRLDQVPLGYTRHLLQGHCLLVRGNFPWSHITVGEGTIKAPDHEDKILEGPHMFFQTAYLRDRVNAD